ncbi:MAG: LEA type 2 family protein [Steroidobacteraceae bacterium]
MKAWFCSALLAVAMTGCSGIVPKLETPQLQVVGVDLLRSDLLTQQLRVRMRVTNPNDRVLPVRSIIYRVEVAGEPFAQGESERNFEVPALGSTEFDVGMTANAAGTLLKLLGSGNRAGALDYRLVGKVQLASGLIRSIPFEEKGSLNLR